MLWLRSPRLGKRTRGCAYSTASRDVADLESPCGASAFPRTAEGSQRVVRLPCTRLPDCSYLSAFADDRAQVSAGAVARPLRAAARLRLTGQPFAAHSPCFLYL